MVLAKLQCDRGCFHFVDDIHVTVHFSAPEFFFNEVFISLLYEIMTQVIFIVFTMRRLKGFYTIPVGNGMEQDPVLIHCWI